jgi:cytochrome c oxidase assembly protein subunit 11
MSDAARDGQTLERTNRGTALKLGVVFVAMFGFSFALVPLYDLLCDITGFGGRTGVVAAQDLDGMVDQSREAKVEFLSNTNSELPWEFKATVNSIRIHPGQVYDATYTARNLADRRVVGQAVPVVTPIEASKYFNKTECFCFSNQALEAGESKQMPLRFIVDKALPKRIGTVTLSYTFFKVDDSPG